MSIYKSDAPELVRVALESVMWQTRMPEEILVVADGNVPALLEQEIVAFRERVVAECLPIEVRYLSLAEHRGLGGALQQAVLMARGDYIARMDADDMSSPDRFERQMKCFEEDPALSVVGGQIAEFEDDDIHHVTGRRIVPLEHEEIARYMKSRNGMNHVTTIIRKSDLLAAGNYQSLLWFEDYYLWVRMLQMGFRFRNVADSVVFVRAGKAQIDRRGGWQYFCRERELFRYMRETQFISRWQYLRNIAERGAVRLLMPLSLRSWFYRRFLRKVV